MNLRILVDKTLSLGFVDLKTNMFCFYLVNVWVNSVNSPKMAAGELLSFISHKETIQQGMDWLSVFLHFTIRVGSEDEGKSTVRG